MKNVAKIADERIIAATSHQASSAPVPALVMKANGAFALGREGFAIPPEPVLAKRLSFRLLDQRPNASAETGSELPAATPPFARACERETQFGDLIAEPPLGHRLRFVNELPEKAEVLPAQ